MSRAVTQIVPYFAPTIDGVGDYALNLARHLRETHNWNSRFIVADSAWSGPASVEDFSVTQVPDHDANFLADAIQGAERVLLHYVGYGYQRRGVPLWLAKGLLRKPCQLTTVFHEIWSQGPPWKSVFYLAPVQRRLVRDFLRASSKAFVSTRGNLRELEAIKPGVAEWLPIPSNLPVPPAEPKRDHRGEKWTLLLFGQTDSRGRAVERHSKLLRELSSRGLVEEILVVGKQARAFPGPSEDVKFLANFAPPEKICVLGEVEQNGGDFFGAADLFLSSHWACNLCKSGAVMAAMAAGCPVVVCDRSDLTPLAEDQQALVCDGSASDVDSLIQKRREGVLDRVGAAGREWFLRNANWPMVSAKIAAGLGAR